VIGGYSVHSEAKGKRPRAEELRIKGKDHRGGSVIRPDQITDEWEISSVSGCAGLPGVRRDNPSKGSHLGVKIRG